jgi:hypothetical protein
MYMYVIWTLYVQRFARHNPRASALSFNALRAMSALLCGGPVFSSKVLDKDSTLYRWLENMLSSGESRVSVYRRILHSGS